MNRYWGLVVAMVAGAACTRADDRSAREEAPAAAPTAAAPTAPAPTPPPAPTARPQPTCSALAMRLQPDGIWVGDAAGRRFVAACKGEPDAAALAVELCDRAAKWSPDCGRAVEVGAPTGVTYAHVVTGMDRALAAGFDQVALSDAAKLSVSFPDAVTDAERASPRCGAPALACSPAAAPPAGGSPAPAGAAQAPPGGTATTPPGRPTGADLKQVPIIAVRADGAVLLDGRKVAGVKLPAADGALEPLRKALAERPPAADPEAKGMLVLQADRKVDAALINLVVAAASAAGFDNVLFAVKTAS